MLMELISVNDAVYIIAFKAKIRYMVIICSGILLKLIIACGNVIIYISKTFDIL